MISTGARLAEFLAALGRGGWVALDTEFMRERTYAPQLCLVQLDDGENAACIDAPALRDLSPLADLLADESVVKIVHSCRQDLEALDTRGRLPQNFRNLYDTQLAAAFCGYGAQVSYAALVEELCDVHLPKSHTRADWSRRPLPPAQIQYALDDVKYLQPLRGALDRLLEKNGRADWLREECARAADPASNRFDPAGAWRRVKGAGRLDPAGRACVKELALWRERRARARDLPRNWVLPDAVLLQICRDRPRAEKQLARIEGLAAGLRKHAGREIVEIVARAEAAAKNDDGGKDEERAGPLTAQQRRLAKEILKWLEERAKDAGMSRTLVAARRDIGRFRARANRLAAVRRLARAIRRRGNPRALFLRFTTINGQQHGQTALLAHDAGGAFGARAMPPEQIGAQRAGDRAAGVLRHHQPAIRAARCAGVIGGEPHRRAEFHHRRIYRDAALRAERNIERAARARIFSSRNAKKTYRGLRNSNSCARCGFSRSQRRMPNSDASSRVSSPRSTKMRPMER